MLYQIREDVKSGVYVENLTEGYVKNLKELSQLLIKVCLTLSFPVPLWKQIPLYSSDCSKRTHTLGYSRCDTIVNFQNNMGCETLLCYKKKKLTTPLEFGRLFMKPRRFSFVSDAMQTTRK